MKRGIWCSLAHRRAARKRSASSLIQAKPISAGENLHVSRETTRRSKLTRGLCLSGLDILKQFTARLERMSPSASMRSKLSRPSRVLNRSAPSRSSTTRSLMGMAPTSLSGTESRPSDTRTSLGDCNTCRVRSVAFGQLFGLTGTTRGLRMSSSTARKGSSGLGY